MAQILDDYQQETHIKNAVHLINNLDDLKAQKTQVQNDIAAFKIVHAASIAADNWIPNEFKQAHILLESITSINIKIPEVKTELANLKALILNAQYKIDIQAAIDAP